MCSTATAKNAAACSCGRDLAAARTVLSLADSSKGSIAPLSPRSRACGSSNPQDDLSQRSRFAKLAGCGGKGGAVGDCASTLAGGLFGGRPLLVGQMMRPKVCRQACRLSACFATPARAASASPCPQEALCADRRRFLSVLTQRMQRLLHNCVMTGKMCAVKEIPVVQTLTFRFLCILVLSGDLFMSTAGLSRGIPPTAVVRTSSSNGSRRAARSFSCAPSDVAPQLRSVTLCPLSVYCTDGSLRRDVSYVFRCLCCGLQAHQSTPR